MDEISDVYKDAIRYKPETLSYIFRSIDKISKSPIRKLIDVGVGTGYSLEIASYVFGQSKLVGVDVMPEMIEKAKFRKYKLDPDFLLSSAEDIRITKQYSNLTYSCCAFHLFRNKSKAASEMMRVTQIGGIVAIIGYSHSDLKTQIFHKLFPSFSRRELEIHIEAEELESIFTDLGGEVVGSIRKEFSLSFKDAEQLKELIHERQFFGLRTMPDEEFEKGKIEFSRKIVAEFQNQRPISESAITATIIRVL